MRSRACVLVLLSGVTAPAVAGAQSASAPSREAEQLFLEGRDHYEARRYGQALESLRASLARYSTPNTRLYVARSLRGLGRFDEAVLEYERTVREAAEREHAERRYHLTRTIAADELSRVEPSVARLAVSVPGAPAGVRVRLGAHEFPLEATRRPVPVLPGRLRIAVVGSEGRHAEREVQLVAGQELEIEVPLAGSAPSDPSDPRDPRVTVRTDPPRGVGRTGGWVFLGVGGATLIASGVFWGLATDRLWTLQRECPQMDMCPPRLQPVAREGLAFETVATVTSIVGLTSLVIGTAWVVLAPASGRPQVRLGMGPASLFVGGSF